MWSISLLKISIQLIRFSGTCCHIFNIGFHFNSFWTSLLDSIWIIWSYSIWVIWDDMDLFHLAYYCRCDHMRRLTWIRWADPHNFLKFSLKYDAIHAINWFSFATSEISILMNGVSIGLHWTNLLSIGTSIYIKLYAACLNGKIILIVKSSLNKSLRKEFECTGTLNAVNKEHGRWR